MHLSSSYHPQTDGQTEVVNKCVESYLRCICSQFSGNWVKWFPIAEYWYNTNFHSALEMTPIQILYGIVPPLHISYFPGDSPNAAVDCLLQEKKI